MHTPLRKVAYLPTQKTWFCVVVTDRSEFQKTTIKCDYRIDAPSPAAAELQALCLYLKRYSIDEQDYLINTGRVTASVLTHADKDGRIVPFDDRRYPGPIRVMILVSALLFGCALIWLMIANVSQALDLLNATVAPTKGG